VPSHQWGMVTLDSNLDKPVKIATGYAHISRNDLEEKSEIQTRDKTPKDIASPQILSKEQFSFQKEDRSQERLRHVRVRVYSSRLWLQDMAGRQRGTETVTERFEVSKVPPRGIPMPRKRRPARELPSSASHEPRRFRRSQSI
jgi:hypothetical protein